MTIISVSVPSWQSYSRSLKRYSHTCTIVQEFSPLISKPLGFLENHRPKLIDYALFGSHPHLFLQDFYTDTNLEFGLQDYDVRRLVRYAKKSRTREGCEVDRPLDPQITSTNDLAWSRICCAVLARHQQYPGSHNDELCVTQSIPITRMLCCLDPKEHAVHLFLGRQLSSDMVLILPYQYLMSYVFVVAISPTFRLLVESKYVMDTLLGRD